jgi:hypothetical protein
MDRCVGAAARLPGSDRKDLAIHALARSETVSDLAARHGVSRKFVYQQTSSIRAGSHDEIFQGATAVLAGLMACQDRKASKIWAKGNPFGTERHETFASNFCIEEALINQRAAFGSDVLTYRTLIPMGGQSLWKGVRHCA